MLTYGLDVPNGILSASESCQQPPGKGPEDKQAVPRPLYLGEVCVVHVGEETASLSHAEH